MMLLLLLWLGITESFVLSPEGILPISTRPPLQGIKADTDLDGPPTATAAIMRVPTSATVTSECADTITTCSHYGLSMCSQDTYKPWVQAHCALFCSMCDPAVTNPSKCTDTIPNCYEYDDGDLCRNNPYTVWTYDNCRGYCKIGHCRGGPSSATAAMHVPTKATVTSDCEDVSNKCSSYGRTVCSQEKYRPWVKVNCRRYCAMCIPAHIDSSECKDKVPNCSEYDDGTLCTASSYNEWVDQNCRGYCKIGLCSIEWIRHQGRSIGILQS